jgi:hypothetical protein
MMKMSEKMIPPEHHIVHRDIKPDKDPSHINSNRDPKSETIKTRKALSDVELLSQQNIYDECCDLFIMKKILRPECNQWLYASNVSVGSHSLMKQD